MFEKLIFKRVELWLLLLILIFGLIAVSLFAWTAQYKAGGGEKGGKLAEVALAVAQAPTPFMRLIVRGTRAIQPQMINFSAFSGFDIVDSTFSDDGYLLVSGYRPENKISTAYLYDLSRRKILHQWVPPMAEILGASSYRHQTNSARNYRTQHPFLFADGDLVFTSGEGPLVRIDRCGKLRWVVDRHFHHTIEQDATGALIVPHVLASPTDKDSLTTSGHRIAPIRDDGFAVISPEGEIIKEWSVKKILEDNGYIGLLYGVGLFEPDRIHLNDAQPILETDKFVERGDFILSSRNLSTVFLYRPRTNKILWLKTGPWLNQHDVDYQGNGTFTIFGNDAVRTKNGERKFAESSSIYLYDQSKDTVERVFTAQTKNIFTATQGLHEVLPNGDLFVEESDKDMLYRISPKGPRWRFVNTTGDGTIGALHWCRYLSREQVKLDWLSDVNCNS
jgi:hypothetical protein